MIYQLEFIVVIHIIYYMQTETFLIIFVYIFTNFIASYPNHIFLQVLSLLIGHIEQGWGTHIYSLFFK